jgi:hypothetical protein
MWPQKSGLGRTRRRDGRAAKVCFCPVSPESRLSVSGRLLPFRFAPFQPPRVVAHLPTSGHDIAPNLNGACRSNNAAAQMLRRTRFDRRE